MAQIKLHNTKTRHKEIFEPIDAANVRLYLCGPTVYDRAHIGNARNVIMFDVLYRLPRIAAMKSKDFSQVDQMKAMLTGAGVEVRMSKAGVDLLPSAGFDATKLEPSP